ESAARAAARKSRDVRTAAAPARRVRRLQLLDRAHQQAVTGTAAARRRHEQDHLGRDLVLQVEDNARIRVIRFNRPEAMNAFNDELYHAAGYALEEASASDDVACVVLTGTGRAF